MGTFRQYAAIAALVLVGFSSCKEERSPVTGWAYNKKENGGFDVVPYEEQETGPGLVLIEGGTFTMGRNEQDVTYDWNNIPRRVTVSSFYMDMTEITNVNYREYLYWTSRVYGSEFNQIYVKALPDTLVWREKLAFNEPYVEYYFRHPAFRDYPLVGVNWLQANDYCSWRTDRVNELILIREGFLKHNPNPTPTDYFNTDAYLAGKLDPPNHVLMPSSNSNTPERKIKIDDGIFLPRYRLPTEAEWEYAAYSLIGNTVDELITDRRLYPWNGAYVRNPDEKYFGDLLANYKRSNGDNMGAAGHLNDAADITAPVYAYWPNDYGLYNMAGNVSEWVMDTYRVLSPEDKDDFRPLRGNVFKTAVVNQNGQDGIVINTDSIILDKDSNIIQIPGQVRMRDVSIAYNQDNLDERRNYNYADNINFNDGDANSSIYYNDPTAQDERKWMYEYGQYSMVNNKAKVYKGGSWRDRAYWMSPGTRRFLDQRQATAYIGFRCCMDRLGSPIGLGAR